MTLAVSLAAAALFADAQRNGGRESLSSWRDDVLKVRFPASLAGLRLAGRHTYGRGDLDYSLAYKPDGEDERSVAGEWLDLYVYIRPDRPAEQPRAAEEVADSLSATKATLERNGTSGVFVNTNILTRVWEETGLTNAVGLCECDFAGKGGTVRSASVVSVTALSGRFLKLRYSVPLQRGEEVPARRFGEICAALDSLLAASARRARIDVYSAGGGEATFKALLAKWPEAGERVSHWAMPSLAEKVDKIEAASEWCVQDYTNRIATFEAVSRSGIETRTNPAKWHYNLACALAMQGRTADAFEALEQAVAAGFSDADHMERDPDLVGIRADARFAKLAAAARAVVDDDVIEPLKPVGGECIVGEENVAYSFMIHSYRCILEGCGEDTVVYVNKNADHPAVPCEGLVVPSFDEEARELGAISDTADVIFARRSGPDSPFIWCPTVVACANACGDVSSSIPARLAYDGRAANGELCLEGYNAMGVYAVSAFGADGTDAFSCWCPGFIAHTGGAAEGDKFVKLFADVVRALPPGIRGGEFPISQLVQKIIRSSQRGVEDEQDFMSGPAMRPVLDFGDIDAARAVAAAKAVDPKGMPPVSPYFKTVTVPGPVAFLGGTERETSISCSAHHAGVLADWIGHTATIEVRHELAESGCSMEWKVLSGDASHVRISPAGDGATRISVDWTEPFDEVFPSGRSLRSSRIDIGCFAVRDGQASVPCILSVYFPPNEIREYTSDGKLRARDYIASQFAGELPDVCPRGDWRDEPRYGDDGALTGWLRYRKSPDGGVVAEEFTAEGLVVVTRDGRRRPLLCRYDPRPAWLQSLPAKPTPAEVERCFDENSRAYDSLDAQPCGENAATLVWEYAYDEGGRGSASPVRPVPFRHRPELCPGADFGAESGFGVPLLAQMRIGYGVYSEYKMGRVPAVHGTPVKLRFAKRASSAHQAWPSDAGEFEAAAAKRLVELGDGVYRALSKDDGSGDCYSVEWTYLTMNRASEYVAFSGMEGRYARCDEDEVLAVLSSRTNSLDISTMFVNTGSAPVPPDRLPAGKRRSCAMWRINDALRFGAIADFDDRFEKRSYFFSVLDAESGGALTWDSFEEFPSAEIGETVLAAARHEPDAVNNLAVLIHAGICNSGRNGAAAVLKLLEFSAKAGCAEAAENLRTLRGDGRAKPGRPPAAPVLIGSMMGEYTPVCDIWDERWELPHREMTPMRHVYCWNGAENTVKITATVEAAEGELKWKLLQGDPGKVKLLTFGNASASVRAEIDWHGLYSARGRDGKMRRTTRVEFGCVAVKDGVESEPCVVSVSASPHATREYDEAGWLRRIDYRTPLLPGKVSSRFHLGDWVDEFEYTPDGRLMGWTRTRSAAGGAEEKECFTRDGLKILSRDSLGRPLKCERDYRATLYQRTARGERAEHPGFAPERFEYRYRGIEDYMGRAVPVK